MDARDAGPVAEVVLREELAPICEEILVLADPWAVTE